jgi:hypothetical protein
MHNCSDKYDLRIPILQNVTPCTLISKNRYFGGLAIIFQAARSSEKSVPTYQSVRPFHIRVLEFLSLLLCQNFISYKCMIYLQWQ